MNMMNVRRTFVAFIEEHRRRATDKSGAPSLDLHPLLFYFAEGFCLQLLLALLCWCGRRMNQSLLGVELLPFCMQVKAVQGRENRRNRPGRDGLRYWGRCAKTGLQRPQPWAGRSRFGAPQAPPSPVASILAGLSSWAGLI